MLEKERNREGDRIGKNRERMSIPFEFRRKEDKSPPA
jgi:hypothetical protein